MHERHRKEKPLLSLTGSGGGLGYLAGRVTGPSEASATGGTVISSGDDRYNVFTGTGTYTVSNGPVTAKVLIVSGGAGGGGYYYAGGGGAGGVVYSSSIELASGSYPVVV